MRPTLPDAVDTDCAAIIDASHPCETQTPGVIANLAARKGVPLLRLRRPGWKALDADRWICVRGAMEARAALSQAHRTPFLCLGAIDRLAFAGDPERRYLMRIRTGAAPPPHSRATVLDAPGPYTVESEARLMQAHGADVLVARNAGGEGAWPKIEAARALGLTVIMLERPAAVSREVSGVEGALAWLRGLGLA